MVLNWRKAHAAQATKTQEPSHKKTTYKVASGPEEAQAPEMPKPAILSLRPAKAPESDEVSGRITRIEDSSTLIVDRKTIKLFGVEGRSGPFIGLFQDYLAKYENRVTCRPVKAQYICFVGPQADDVGRAAIFFGGALAAHDAPDSYHDAQMRAQYTNTGLWQRDGSIVK
jgi:hypothetical protein